MAVKCDFSGVATKYNVMCSDGRKICKGAFDECNGKRLPLVWQHQHNDPENVLGHAVLETRDDCVYAYATFNDSENGRHAKLLVEHGDINSLSIYANQLKQRGSDVIHGVIREVSLVLAGANPGALIDNVAIAHGDGSSELIEDAAVIYFGEELRHADESEDSDDGETVGDVFDTLTEKQKNVVYAIIAEAVGDDGDGEDDEEMAQSGMEDGIVKKNVFEELGSGAQQKQENTLSHADFSAIIKTAQDNKMTLSEAYKQYALAHDMDPVAPGIAGVDYGVANLELLFPEYQNVRSQPDVIARDDAWVSTILNGANKTPFARIKTWWFDITADVARARGYRKGHLKKEEVVKLAQRVTGPTTIYKKQRLDRDDIIDITNFDIVAWLKQEMQKMLREEIARAVLISDGRPIMKADGTPNEDKIEEDCIRPIYKENELYAYHVEVPMSGADNDVYKAMIDQIYVSMGDYKGSGSPTFFTTREHHIKLRKVHDQIDRRLYNTDAELATALGVGSIVDVPVLEGIKDEQGHDLIGIIVNMADYTIGTNRGGQTAFFDDFDIDYNQYKYLYETRLSGALTRPDSAIIVEAASKAPLSYYIAPMEDMETVLESSISAEDCQSDVVVTGTNNIDGKLHYVTDFTEYAPGDEKLQEGHYLALKFTKDGTESNAKLSYMLTNSTDKRGWTDVPSGGEVVLRITDEMTQRLKVRISGTAGTKTQQYNLSGLVLEPKE